MMDRMFGFPDDEAPLPIRSHSFSLNSTDSSVDEDDFGDRNEARIARMIPLHGRSDRPLRRRVASVWVRRPAIEAPTPPRPKWRTRTLHIMGTPLRFLYAQVDRVAERMIERGTQLWMEFQSNDTYFSSTVPTLAYVACILTAVHVLGLVALRRYQSELDVNRWCTMVTAGAVLTVALPTMSAPGVLSRCHTSAWLVFVGAVCALVAVDQGAVPPLDFAKRDPISRNIWDVVDLEKMFYWILVSFVGLLPHTLGTTSTGSGRWSAFVTGWALSVGGLTGVLQYGTAMVLPLVLFWTGLFVLNATALVQPYAATMVQCHGRWIGALGGPVLVLYACTSGSVSEWMTYVPYRSLMPVAHFNNTMPKPFVFAPKERVTLDPSMGRETVARDYVPRVSSPPPPTLDTACYGWERALALPITTELLQGEWV